MLHLGHKKDPVRTQKTLEFSFLSKRLILKENFPQVFEREKKISLVGELSVII